MSESNIEYCFKVIIYQNVTLFHIIKIRHMILKLETKYYPTTRSQVVNELLKKSQIRYYQTFKLKYE